MARRYGIINKKYDSQIRRCAVSGLRFYQSEMVRTREGTYVHPKYLDADYRSHARGARTVSGVGSAAADDMARALIRARPYGTPLAARCAGEMVGLYRGGVY